MDIYIKINQYGILKSVQLILRKSEKENSGKQKIKWQA